ncbi:hypothetical protein LWM68_20970 [Niabella sp. W65]|nr:hypothetical protein [Niabella sp. W65]MCH7365013.1 hypothetical protein [Niabella sp. W65]ULT40832.1 hypothetical protein KRR40_39860 [Niabella sp. I65]
MVQVTGFFASNPKFFDNAIFFDGPGDAFYGHINGPGWRTNARGSIYGKVVDSASGKGLEAASIQVYQTKMDSATKAPKIYW